MIRKVTNLKIDTIVIISLILNDNNYKINI